MKTIQVVIEADLLRAADRAARRLKLNRSALVRQALRAHLDAMRRSELERADRRGYERQADTAEELAVWEKVAAWPKSKDVGPSAG
jgi:metal-responsive CopG/Arc/MetJ family transcriptional regulator